MAVSDEALIDLLEKAFTDKDPANDIIKAKPDLTIDDVYRLQLGLKRRQAEQGDPIAGYRVSLTNKLAYERGFEARKALGDITDADRDVIHPIFATILHSHLGDEQTPIKVPDGRYGNVEAEVGVLMGADLEGPFVTATQARGAIAGYYAAIDFAHHDRSATAFSPQHDRATKGGPGDFTMVFGAKLTPPTIDLRFEGLIVSANGEIRASGAGWESLGDPVNAVVWLANTLSRYGERLRADQVVITGLTAPAVRLSPGDRTARADFTRLGGVSIRLARSIA
jgi:2-keto-4-pentenoate hydratase